MTDRERELEDEVEELKAKLQAVRDCKRYLLGPEGYGKNTKRYRVMMAHDVLTATGPGEDEPRPPIEP